MPKTDHTPGLHLTGYSNNALLDDEAEALDVEFEPVCPKNGWSMNEIWKHAYISPPPGFWIMEDSGPLRRAYDYGEPAGYPTPKDPHSTIPGDWAVTEDGRIVSYRAQQPGRSQVRKKEEGQ